jgi:hypothetical protein
MVRSSPLLVFSFSAPVALFVIVGRYALPFPLIRRRSSAQPSALRAGLAAFAATAALLFVQKAQRAEIAVPPSVSSAYSIIDVRFLLSQNSWTPRLGSSL